MRGVLILLTLAVLLLVAGGVLAMSSANYRLDWFTPLTGGGGGPANSTNYAANFTVGQSAIGFSASDNYTAGMGFWYGITGYGITGCRIYLPLALKDFG